MPPPSSIATALQNGPWAKADVQGLFPTQDEKDAFVDLAKVLHAARKANEDAATRWQRATAYRDLVLSVLERVAGL